MRSNEAPLWCFPFDPILHQNLREVEVEVRFAGQLNARGFEELAKSCPHLQAWVAWSGKRSRKNTTNLIYWKVCIYIYAVVYTYRSWWLHTFHKCWLPDTRWKRFFFHIIFHEKSSSNVTQSIPFHPLPVVVPGDSFQDVGQFFWLQQRPSKGGGKRDGSDTTHRRVRGAKDVVLDGSVVNMVTKVCLNHGKNTDETFHCFSFFRFQYSSAINESFILRTNIIFRLFRCYFWGV